MSPTCLAPHHARIYAFDDQLQIGHEGERAIDQTMGAFYNIRPASKEQDYNLGIDRIWEDQTGAELFAQYKLDCIGHRTQKVFLEFALRDSHADVIVFLLPGLRRLLIFTGELTLSIDDWAEKYGIRQVENAGYSAPGVPVPLDELLPSAWYILPVCEADLPCHRCVWASQNAA